MDHEDEALRRYLDGRLAVGHLEARLRRETPGGEPIFDWQAGALHLENASVTRFCLRWALRLSGLYTRGRRNTRALQIREHRLAMSGLPASMRGFRLLQISDPHIDIDADFPAYLAQQLRGLSWDACVITGDIRYKTNGNARPAMAGLEHMLEALDGPVYAILGNHDSIRMVPSMEALGVRVLLNEGVVLGDGNGSGVWLAGVDDPHYYRQDDVRRALRERPDTMPVLLLAHSPEAYGEALAAGVDAMLCGHTHGGQIRLPGGIPLVTNADCPRDLKSGAWQWQALTGYTSVGAGSSVLDVRYNCPPEVVIHYLEDSL
ncbi:metallophosphoesterase [Aquisalimonas sp.]|uniref:metallophosphoesterase n=1 Tax=Aquisalimonas sp. TaxID=1872621 RepID=UPI0025BC8A55|nr:metallophosphoesterase [Aquisalimonas sp.]